LVSFLGNMMLRVVRYLGGEVFKSLRKPRHYITGRAFCGVHCFDQFVNPPLLRFEND